MATLAYTLSSEPQVGGNSQVRFGSLSPALSGDSMHPVVSRMGQWREDRIWRKETRVSGFGQVSALSVNLNFLS